MKTTPIVIALLIVAAAIVFHAWYPEYKAEQRYAELFDTCMEALGNEYLCQVSVGEQLK